MASDAVYPPKRRKKVQTKRPNPLFEQWITEWKEEAEEKGWPIRYNMAKALKTLKQFPLCLKSGKECAVLKNFGAKLCLMLDKKLAEYRKENPDVDLDSVPGVPAATPVLPVPAALPALPDPAAKRKAAPKRNVAAKTTTNGASTSAASLPPAKKPTATRKKRVAASVPSSSQSTDMDSQTEAMIPQVDVLIPAGSVKVKLIVDLCETSKGTKVASKVATKKELEAQGIPFEMRKLNVGDFVWVASDGNHDLVLPFVVERKRIDDLAFSIKKGRYHEQKWRLRGTGFQVVYLIESINVHISLPLETLCQAETNTEINDQFCIHRTYGVKDTVSYLATMTKVLQKKFQNKTLRNCKKDQGPVYSLTASTIYLFTLAEYNSDGIKIENFTVQEMFALQLLQISGASVDAVSAIVERFRTPALLRQEFASKDCEANKLALLTSLKFGTLKRSLPQEVARRIHLFYTVMDFNNIQR